MTYKNKKNEFFVHENSMCLFEVMVEGMAYQKNMSKAKLQNKDIFYFFIFFWKLRACWLDSFTQIASLPLDIREYKNL